MIRTSQEFIKLLAVGVACTALGGCDLFTAASDRVDRAEALLHKGAYNEAMIELRNAVEAEPANGRAQLLVARTNLQLGNFPAAEQALNAAQAAKVEASKIAEVRARLLLHSGKDTELLSALESSALAVSDPLAGTLRAQALGALGRCDGAITLARTMLAADPKLAELRVVVAECYGRVGEDARALREIDAGLALVPNDAASWMTRGRVQLLSGDKAGAEASWIKAAEVAAGQLTVPQQVVLLAALADLQIERGGVEDVRATWQRLTQVAPGATLTDLLAVRINLMEGDVTTAIRSLRLLATRAPQLPAVHLLLVSANLAQANFEQVRQELAWLETNSPQSGDLKSLRSNVETLAKVAPDTEEYSLRLAAAQSAIGQTGLARTALAAAQLRAPQSITASLALAQLELRAGNPDETLRITNPLAEASADNLTVTALRAEAMVAKRDYASAGALFEKLWAAQRSAALALSLHNARKQGKIGNENEPLEQWLAKNPRDVVVRATLAEHLLESGENRRAIAEYEKLLEVAPRSAPALNNLAWLYYLEKDPRAVATARQASELAPKSPKVLDTYGWLLVEAGSVDEGLTVLKKADDAGGIVQPDIRYHYSAALARKGETRQARELLQALLKEASEFSSHSDATRLLTSLEQTAAT